MANVDFKMGFQLDKQGFNEAKSEIAKISQQLESKKNLKIESGSIDKIKGEVNALDKAFDKAFDRDLNKLNLKALNSELKKSGTSLSQIQRRLSDAGVSGTQAFQSINREVLRTGVEIKKSKSFLDEMVDTLGKTAKWSIASGAINKLQGSLQKAIGYVKGMDESLNNIRVVTGKTAEEMRSFKDEANEAAKALGKTTKEYSDASLLYFQQGKSAEEVRKLTEATLVGANITGIEVSTMADLLTAALNGYVLEADKAMEVTDKLAAVGAATGSDFGELATGMSKVASMAKVVGVDIDQLNAQLATITTVTREAPESIGTSLKTIFGRMSELKAGKEDEEGWTTGKVEKTFQKAGLTVIDKETKQLKEMGVVIEEVGNKWGTFNKSTQLALANAMAGQRQANRLIALFEQWDMYQDALTVSQESSGAAMEQNEIRMDSLEYKSKQLRTEFEELWGKLVNDDVLKFMTDSVRGVVSGVNDLIDGFGGMGNVAMAAGGAIVNMFSKKIGSSIVDVSDKINSLRMKMKEGGGLFSKGSKMNESEKAEESAIRSDLEAKNISEKAAERELKLLNDRVRLRKQEEVIQKNLGAEELKKFQATKNSIIAEQEKLRLLAQERAERAKSAEKRLSEGSFSGTFGEQGDILQTERALIAAKEQSLQIEKERENELRIIQDLKKTDFSIEDLQLMKAKEGTDEITRQEQALLRVLDANDLVLDGYVDINDLVEDIDEMENTVNDSLEHHQSLLMEIEQAELDILSIREEQNDVSIEGMEESQNRLNDLEAEAAQTERNARRHERIQKAVQGVGLAIGILGSMKGLKVLGDDAATLEEKMNAVQSSAAGVGAILMTTGNPYMMIAGGLIAAAGAAAKFISENVGIGKIINQNKKTLEDYQAKLARLNETKKGLINTSSQYNRIEELEAGGLINAELEEYNTLVEEMASATPEVVAYYDAYGNAVLKTRGEIESLTKAIDEQVKAENKSMSSKASSFTTEMAYLTTKGVKEKANIQAEIDKLTSEIDTMYLEGRTQKSIDKKSSKLDELYAQMDDIQERFNEIGKTAQDSVITPFIGANDVFKEIGKEYQGFTTALFNPDEIQKGLNEISNRGITDTKLLKKASETYINGFKSGLLEVAESFKLIQNAGDKATKQLATKLTALPEATKKAIGGFALEMTPFMDEKEIMKQISTMSSFIDENGKINAYKMMDYFKQVGVEARKSIEGDMAEAAKKVKEVLSTEYGNGPFAKEAIEQLREEVSGSTTIDNIKKQQILDAIKEYKAGNTEILEQLYLDDEKTRVAIDAQIEELKSSFFSEGERQSGEALEEAFGSLAEQNELVRQLNESFGDTNTLVDNYASKLAQTAEGQQFIVDMWNKMVSITEEVGEGGLFSVDLIELDAQREELESLGESAKDAGVDVQSLEQHAQNIGEAFEDVLSDKNLSTAFQELSGMTEEQMSNIKRLADLAKQGNIEAAKSLQSEMGKVYATMYAQDANYFNNFVRNNRARLDDVALVTGIEADQYANLADYQAALQGFITQVGGQENYNRLIDLQSYLGTQVAAMGDAANQTVNINGQQMNAAQRAASISALAVSVAAADAGKFAANGGAAAARSFIDSLKGVDEGANATLEAVKARISDKGAEFDAIIQMINAEMAKMAAGDGNAPTLNLNVGNYKAPSINYKPPSGSIQAPSAPKPTKPPGTAGPSVGGGGGGDKDKKGKKDKEEKEVEDLEWEEDKYHDINIQLELKSQLLDKLKKQQDKLYGKELLNNLAQQKKALQEQQALLEKKLQMQKEDLADKRKDLASKGVTFNADDTIANYNQLLKSKQEAVNKLSGEAKEAAKEEFQNLVDLMGAYEDLILSSINETENAIQDSIDAQREIFLQEFDYKINVQLELTGDVDKALQFQKDFFDTFQDADENFERTMGQYSNKIGEMQAIGEQIKAVYEDTTLSDKERFERLDDLNEKLKTAALDAKKLSEALTEIYKDTLKDGLDVLKEHSEEYERLNDEITHMQQMMKLLGKETDYEAMDKMYEAQYGNLTGQIALLNKQKDTLVKEREALEAAGLKGSDEWKALNEAINDTTKDLDKLAQETLKVLEGEFKNSVSSIMDSLDKFLGGGKSLKELKKEYDQLKKDRKEYLDIEEKITEVGKLQGKINKDLKGITDPKKLEAIQKFKDKELKALKEKDKLTKYDVDRANLLYDITIKQMALEEQKNAKNMMRLVRDAAGNWAYEFVEDNEAVEKAREELSDALEKLQELDKKQFEKAQEDMLSAKLEFEKEIQSIIDKQMKGEYKTDEEFKQALANAQTKFNETMKEKSDALNEAQKNGVTSSLATILLAYQENTQGLGILAGEQEEMMKTLATTIGGDFTLLGELMKALNAENQEDFANMAEQMGLDEELLRGTLESINSQIKEDWGGSITDMIGNTDSLETETKSAIDEILANWEEYKNKVDETTNSTGNSIKDLGDRLEEVKNQTISLNGETDNLIQKFADEINQMTAVVTKNAELKKSYDDVTSSIAKQISELDKLIQKKKEESTGVTTPGAGSGGGSGSSGGGGGGSTPPPAPKPPPSPGGSGSSGKTPSYTKGEAVTVTKNTSYFENSRGEKKRGPAYTGTKYLVDDPKSYKPMKGASHEIHISNSKGGDLGWVKKSELKKFKTGGYTGSFGNDVIDGKMAILHEKELVLNKEDTKNILDAVNVIRGRGDIGETFMDAVSKYTSIMMGSIERLGSRMMTGSSAIGTRNKDEKIKQEVNINADFSGVRSADEIEKAFESLSIQASQYASKRD